MPSPMDTLLRVQASPVPTQTVFGLRGSIVDRADRLHGLVVEDGLEGRAAVLRLPDAAAGRADVDHELAVRHRRRRRAPRCGRSSPPSRCCARRGRKRAGESKARGRRLRERGRAGEAPGQGGREARRLAHHGDLPTALRRRGTRNSPPRSRGMFTSTSSSNFAGSRSPLGPTRSQRPEHPGDLLVVAEVGDRPFPSPRAHCAGFRYGSRGSSQGQDTRTAGRHFSA